MHNLSFKINLFAIGKTSVIILAALMTISCSQGAGFKPSSSNETAQSEKPRPTPRPPSESDKEVPLLWEIKKPETRAWTLHVYSLIQDYGADLMQGASDVESFCPMYYRLNTERRINFWAYLVSAMVKYESNFNPVARMHETTMGTDPITGQPVYSEGLMQLSYQDVRPYPFCDEFDWSVDRHLSPTDPRKTILDPYKNLRCGVRILNRMIGRYNKITTTKGQYWAVIKPNSKYNKISSIRALTKSVPFCTN